MSKGDTKYTESERELTDTVLSNFGLNPMATRLLVKSYIDKIAPNPINFDYALVTTPMGSALVQEHVAEIYLSRPGYLGKKKPFNMKALDQSAVKLFARSYLSYIRPRPMSFTYMGIEVHIRTKGVSDEKNIARNIFNKNT